LEGGGEAQRSWRDDFELCSKKKEGTLKTDVIGALYIGKEGAKNREEKSLKGKDSSFAYRDRHDCRHGHQEGDHINKTARTAFFVQRDPLTSEGLGHFSPSGGVQARTLAEGKGRGGEDAMDKKKNRSKLG